MVPMKSIIIVWSTVTIYIYFSYDVNFRFLTETDAINDRSLLNIDDVSGDINQIFQLKMRLNKEWAPILDLIRESELFAKLPGQYWFYAFFD